MLRPSARSSTRILKATLRPDYDLDLTVEEKIRTIAQIIYGADDVTFTNQAMKSLKDIKALGGDALPVCIAKTQYSLSDDPTLLGRPTGFNITIRDLRLSNGAGFVVAYAGDVMTMPVCRRCRLPKRSTSTVTA